MDLSIDHIALLFIAAWFIQMGAHEGAHAWVADRLGDDTARLAGKRSFNPLAHIDWSNPASWMLAVVVPIFTALQGMVPLGMAWVPVNPLRLKKWRRDFALVSVAGPAANFAVAGLCLVLHFALSAAAVAPNSLPGILDQLAWAVYLTSVLYGTFNLIPIPPLDGSKVLAFFLPPRGRDLLESLQPYGMWILILLFLVGPAGALIDPILDVFMWVWWEIPLLAL